MSWTEHTHGDTRIRYRPRDGAGPPGQMYEVEYWNHTRQQWVHVRNGSSRDWFALGIAAGHEEARKGVQEELSL